MHRVHHRPNQNVMFAMNENSAHNKDSAQVQGRPAPPKSMLSANFSWNVNSLINTRRIYNMECIKAGRK